jgi:hypothetical protein
MADENVPPLGPADTAKLRMLQHLPTEGDLTLVVLKGHLLLEEILFGMLRAATRYPAAIESARLSFHNLASVAKAIYYEERYDYLWNSIFALNKLRNAYAHRVDPPMLEQLLRDVGIAMGRGNPKGAEQILENPQRFIAIGVAFIGSVLSAIHETQMESRPGGPLTTS